MSYHMNSRLVSAVERGLIARSRFYSSIELEDEQSLGAPAPGEQIDRLQTAWGHQLPASYRAFLALYDGWVMVDGGCDLLRVEQMLSGIVCERIRTWQASMLKWGDPILAAGLVIGFSSISQKRILLDPSVIHNDGEYRLIQWDSDEFIEYASFIEWLEESAQEFEEVANAQKDDED